MQVGRELKESDNISVEQWHEVIRCLEDDFGLRHNDCDRRNGLLIPDEMNPGEERLVAIDLEDVDDFWANRKAFPKSEDVEHLFVDEK